MIARDFILAQPPSASARDVQSAAKKAGHLISLSYIYRLRAAARVAAPTSPTPAGDAGPSKGAHVTKRAFLEACPASWSVPRVLEHAFSEGVRVSPAYAYSIRSGRYTRKARPTFPGASGASATPPPLEDEGSNAEDMALIALIMRVGTARARDCIGAVESMARVFERDRKEAR